MNFYEEFGLSPSASLEEIRQAHRTLARLLHPDQFQEATLRTVAEAQMKRVNEVYSMLADAEARRQYDKSLQRGLAARLQTAVGAGGQEGDAKKATPWQSVLWDVARRNGGLGAATISAVFLIHFILSSQTAPPKAAGPPVAAAAPASTESASPAERTRKHRDPVRIAAGDEALEETLRQNRRLRQQLQDALTERDEVLARWRGEMASSGPPLRPVEDGKDSREPERVATPRENRETANAATGGKRGLAGTWVYLPSRFRRDPEELYPPEYIEIVIAVAGGRLAGRYQARYRVLDRAISPDVRFRFEGDAGAGAPQDGRFEWSGANGSRGEVQLKLAKENELSVTWFASNLGRDLGLSSGTAVLVRRVEP